MSIADFLKFITYIAPLLLAAGVGIGLHYFKNLKKEYKYTLFYLLGCLITDVTARVVGEITKNNLIIIVLFSFFELIFFTVFYQICFFKRKVWPVIIGSIIFSIYIVWEIFSLWNIPPAEFQTYSKTLSSFLIIFMAINYLLEKIEHKEKNNRVIMLNSAIIIFYSLHLIFFLPINFLINVPSVIKFYFWTANLLLTLIFYAFLIREIWKNGSTQKQLRSGL